MPRSVFAILVLAGVISTVMPSASAASKLAATGGHVVLTADELKWGPGPAGLPPGAKMAVLAGDPRKPGLFSVRLRLPAGYKIPPHWHPTDENVVVLNGTFLIGVGDRWEQDKLKTLPIGGYMMMPTGHHHYAGVQGDTTIQLYGPGPFRIYYVNPADDPRRKSPGP